MAAQLREVLRRMDSGEWDAIAPAHPLHYMYATDPAVLVPGRPADAMEVAALLLEHCLRDRALVCEPLHRAGAAAGVRLD